MVGGDPAILSLAGRQPMKRKKKYERNGFLAQFPLRNDSKNDEIGLVTHFVVRMVVVRDKRKKTPTKWIPRLYKNSSKKLIQSDSLKELSELYRLQQICHIKSFSSFELRGIDLCFRVPFGYLLLKLNYFLFSSRSIKDHF